VSAKAALIGFTRALAHDIGTTASTSIAWCQDWSARSGPGTSRSRRITSPAASSPPTAASRTTSPASRGSCADRCALHRGIGDPRQRRGVSRRV